MRTLGRWLILILVAATTWIVMLRNCDVNCVAVCEKQDTKEQVVSEVEKPQRVIKKAKVVKVKDKQYYDVPLSRELQDHITTICEERNIDPAIVIAMIQRESNFIADIVGDNGNSFGLMQIQPYWHSGRMARLGVTDLLDPFQNVIVGIDLLDELLDTYGGDYGKALTAYNKGHYAGTVTNYAYGVLAYSETIKF